MIETERRRRRRETVGEEGEVSNSIVTIMTMPYDLLRDDHVIMWQGAGGRSSLEERSRELERLKEEVESKVGKI